MNQTAETADSAEDKDPCDLRGMDYSDYHGPRPMHAYRREQRLHKIVAAMALASFIAAWALASML